MSRMEKWLTFGVFAVASIVALSTSPGRVAAETTAGATPSAAASTDTYVGTAKCRMCHMPQFRASAAFTADTTQSVRMVLSAGVTVDSKAAGHAPDPAHGRYGRAALQCESCHGMGSRHVALPASNRDTEARRSTINLPGDGTACRTCHSPHPVAN